MNRMRRYGALLLALALVFSMALGAGAAAANEVDHGRNGSSSIIIHKKVIDVSQKDNLPKGTGRQDTAADALTGKGGVSFTIYKMKDNVEPLVDEDGEVTNFDIDVTDWYTAANRPDGVEPVNGSNGAEGYEGFTSSATADLGDLTFDKLPFGTYKIVEKMEDMVAVNEVFYIQVPTYNAHATLDDWIYDVHVYPKNYDDEKITKEFAQGSGGTAGNEFKYTITVSPLAKADDSATGNIRIIDKMDKRLMVPLPYEDYVTVGYVPDNAAANADPTLLTYNTHYTLTEHATENWLIIELTMTGIGEVNDKAFTASPTGPAKLIATVNAFANPDVAYDPDQDLDADYVGQAWNSAQYERDNKVKIVPGKPSVPYTEPDPEPDPDELPKVPVGGMLIDKYDPSDDTKLENAYFKLYTSEQDAKNGENALTNPTPPAGKDDEFFGPTSSAGALLISNLKVPAGTTQDYWLVEVEAPDGYNLLPGPTKVTINSYGTENLTALSVPIANNKGFLLPRTGGSGTLIFTIVGLSLITIAGVTLILYRRRRKNNDAA